MNKIVLTFLLAICFFSASTLAKAVNEERDVADTLKQILVQHQDLFVKIEEFIRQNGIDIKHLNSFGELQNLFKPENFKKIQALAAMFLAEHPTLLAEFNQVVSAIGNLIPKTNARIKIDWNSIKDKIIPTVINVLPSVISIIGKRDVSSVYQNFLEQHKELISKLNNILLEHGINVKDLASQGSLSAIISPELGKKIFDIVSEYIVANPNLKKEFLQLLIGLAGLKPTGKVSIDWNAIIGQVITSLPSIISTIGNLSIQGKRDLSQIYLKFLEQHKDLLAKLNQLFLDHGINVKDLAAQGSLSTVITPELAQKIYNLVSEYISSHLNLSKEFIQFLVGLAGLRPTRQIDLTQIINQLITTLPSIINTIGGLAIQG